MYGLNELLKKEEARLLPIKWKSIPYVGKEFDESIPVIYTKKGERVRSKSEKILADTFYELGMRYLRNNTLYKEHCYTCFPNTIEHI